MKSGLVGRSILHSRSPWLHEQEGRAQGLDLRYDLIDLTDRGLDDDALPRVVAALREGGYAGFNVTYPFKQKVVPLLDALDASAETVGAVNTVAIRDGRLIGYNTDMSGFRQSVIEGLPGSAMARVLQLGAGGAGAAVASALLSIGVRQLDLADLDKERAQALAAMLGRHFGADRVRAITIGDATTAGVDGIVNATPVGLLSNPGLPIDPDLIDPAHWVADIVYFPIETELLRVARAKGCRTLDGSGMVVNQAAAAFEIITQLPADRTRMRDSFARG
ncbi:shikimate dehydrogenase [Sphingomonas bacterium]|uniref:shikimate dehydrogenase n=1 Tax=Sphingomonas bacterium TaxID=1895847 RepID=UPI0020C5D9CD|nr:shikimate dehydrogenase [Sphingomonas bacterium]